ncbi:nucleotidyltransferase [Chryseobacterium shandongense]|uniref:Nucleotidyltransferase n=1 Tax=Chryseobacterium shandongense TaxID=1493872 RepID=A0AAD0YF49_9FLAO|nr:MULTISPECIES: nucleotidyltransferase [Chryseobacterium]AZA87567.1 nucleotidyltransferase [Chryseobacterium shandongense]AZA96067.1 nucleotidyltransferase [Chryseobacterium shandongense]MPS63849.1 nucleotidyltransferase [Chryseobacterium sp.]
MKIDSYFNDFLSNIRLTASQKADLITGHTTLRRRLLADEDLNDIIISTFLQGSYRRSTAIRPLNGKRADVDVIIVTNLDRESVTPEDAIEKFIPFVKKHYDGKYELQGRSIGIELSYVDLDIVITSAPSEVDKAALQSSSVLSSLMLEDFAPTYEWRLSKGWSEPDLQKANVYLSEAVKSEVEWKTSPLWIPDREAEQWDQTHPLEQIRWTRDKNKNTNKHFVNVVKALKWWRTLQLTNLKYPKGYPIEHMIGDRCPDGISSVAEGVSKTLEGIVDAYYMDYILDRTPILCDRGVPEHDVWKRVSVEDFKSFYDSVKEYSNIAKEALEAESLKEQVNKWRQIFGDKFPPYDDDDDDASGKNSITPSGGFTPRKENSDVESGRFA